MRNYLIYLSCFSKPFTTFHLHHSIKTSSSFPRRVQLDGFHVETALVPEMTIFHPQNLSSCSSIQLIPVSKTVLWSIFFNSFGGGCCPTLSIRSSIKFGRPGLMFSQDNTQVAERHRILRIQLDLGSCNTKELQVTCVCFDSAELGKTRNSDRPVLFTAF